MKTTTNTQPAEIYRQFGLLGYVFQWLDEHPRTASALLWLQVVGILYAVFTYNFTTAL